jgi:hypothetical protein
VLGAELLDEILGVLAAAECPGLHMVQPRPGRRALRRRL